MALPRLILATGVLLVLACSGTGGTFVVDQADKDVLFTVEDLDALIGDEPSKGESSFTKTRDFDGAWNLEYEFEDDARFLYTALFMETDEDSAGWVMVGASLTKSLVSSDDVAYVEDASLCGFGDESECGYLTTAGQNVGVVCSVRDGTDVAMVALGGVDTPMALDCTALVQPMLKAAKTHTPSAVTLEP